MNYEAVGSQPDIRDGCRESNGPVHVQSKNALLNVADVFCAAIGRTSYYNKEETASRDSEFGHRMRRKNPLRPDESDASKISGF